MTGPLRIAVLAPPWFPVPPDRYGGIELVVGLLADGLAGAGHDVTLFASGDSAPARARLAALYDHSPSEHIGKSFWDLRHVVDCLARQDEFDVVNDHSGMVGAALGGLLRTPFVHTVHGPLDGEPGDTYEQICSLSDRIGLISISLSQRAPRPWLPWVANCPNAIDLSRYPLEERPRGDYLLFLGRLAPDKGAHRAIAVAAEAGLPIKLAGKCREPGELEYFEAHVRPLLGPRVEYVGEVPHEEKVELLRNAVATLFPIDWEEPFGLVMLESMACGTPVVATRRGAAPEVIEQGVGGLVVPGFADFAPAVGAVTALDRRAVRASVEGRFEVGAMVAAYEGAYRHAIERSRTLEP
jgi:glycosyltransferase involved in cell wall biosynthesis